MALFLAEVKKFQFLAENHGPFLSFQSQKESACLATMQRLQESLESLSAHSSSSSSSCEQLQPLLGEFRELTQVSVRKRGL